MVQSNRPTRRRRRRRRRQRQQQQTYRKTKTERKRKRKRKPDRHIPFLRIAVGRFLLRVVDDLALARQRALHKGALLLVELTQYTEHGALVHHTAALPPAAGVTRALPACADVSDGADGGRDGLARLARRGL